MLSDQKQNVHRPEAHGCTKKQTKRRVSSAEQRIHNLSPASIQFPECLDGDQTARLSRMQSYQCKQTDLRRRKNRIMRRCRATRGNVWAYPSLTSVMLQIYGKSTFTFKSIRLDRRSLAEGEMFAPGTALTEGWWEGRSMCSFHPRKMSVRLDCKSESERVRLTEERCVHNYKKLTRLIGNTCLGLHFCELWNTLPQWHFLVACNKKHTRCRCLLLFLHISDTLLGRVLLYMAFTCSSYMHLWEGD